MQQGQPRQIRLFVGTYAHRCRMCTGPPQTHHRYTWRSTLLRSHSSEIQISNIANDHQAQCNPQQSTRVCCYHYSVSNPSKLAITQTSPSPCLVRSTEQVVQSHSECSCPHQPREHPQLSILIHNRVGSCQILMILTIGW